MHKRGTGEFITSSEREMELKREGDVRATIKLSSSSRHAANIYVTSGARLYYHYSSDDNKNELTTVPILMLHFYNEFVFAGLRHPRDATC